MISEQAPLQGEPACVTADTPALAAFAALRREQRSALGVTASPGGALLGNLSVSDLRGLRPERWGALALPVRAEQPPYSSIVPG